MIEPKAGASQTTLTQQDVENIPQGANIQISDLVLQLPGVAQDSTSQGDFHIRNEHGNVQYRVNGILLPDGVSGFAQFMETSFISQMSLITGILPAQYGFHTSGILDITTKTGAALGGGSVSAYGGSRNTFTQCVRIWRRRRADRLFLRRALFHHRSRPREPALGSERHSRPQRAGPGLRLHVDLARSEYKAQHDLRHGRGPLPNSQQSGAVADRTRPIRAFGSINSRYGITNFNSANINQNQYERNAYGVMAWQRSVGDVDAQLSYYSRYSDVHFVPDPINDLFFNNVSSDIFRSTFLNGIAGDGAYRLNGSHTIARRLSGERRRDIDQERLSRRNRSTRTATRSTPPFTIIDQSDMFGWQMGAYVQDEWKITPQVTLYSGLRFDQIYQYVDANQFSPRFNLTYQPWWSTLIHIGWGRYFTPPPQDLGRVFPEQLFDGTTNGTAYNGLGNNSGTNSCPNDRACPMSA